MEPRCPKLARPPPMCSKFPELADSMRVGFVRRISLIIFKLPRLELLSPMFNGRLNAGVEARRMNCGNGISEARRLSCRRSVVRLEFSSIGSAGTAVQVKRCAVGRLTAMLSLVGVDSAFDGRSFGPFNMVITLVELSSDGELITATTSS